MNSSEFRVFGQILFGQTWKKELTRALCLSPKSRSVDKMASNQLAISSKTSENFLNLLKAQLDLIDSIIKQIEVPEKVKVLKSDLSVIIFDINGVKIYSLFEEHGPISDVGIMLTHADIANNSTNDMFQSLLIADAAYQLLIENDQKILIDAINTYFDLGHFGESDLLHENF